MNPKPPKLPESVLVVIHTPALEVLLIRRADAVGHVDHWQSVTGSKDTPGEDFHDTAVREVFEETGIACGPGSALADGLCDWDIENIYEIYPQWRHRYAPGVVHNTEHLFSLQVPAGTEVRLSPREHTAYRWLPYLAAAEACFSPSNAEAILMLPRFIEDISPTSGWAAAA
ncbi:dihydroneopterin triphosphate diphosphatase [Rhodoferax koreense]|uniref:Dihydroneopterin triphosphate diphosphatase n=1 Tax=Rhodoferax koreensis TaxID=1842727 RepID=A0A1P8JTX2_9BURK|nr:dihydroneopterin triphosphate diphosphatase [Rhodoferax koreense]APW37193.1 dihydroneopterin triphosphate diphosphatase [Rhodoferax koreense]